MTLSNLTKSGQFDSTVIDFEGQTTSFPSSLPSFSTTIATSSSTLSTLLGSTLSTVDIVPQLLTAEAGGIAGSGGERLHLFNVAEGFVGQVEVAVPEWLTELSGKGQVSGGSARAPMRQSFFLLSGSLPTGMNRY